MSSPTIPRRDHEPSLAEKLIFAERYISAGWHLFIVNESKISFPQCNPCREAGPEHDRQLCDHLLCHGFYAATNDMNRIRRMFELHPNGLLALRTGQPSGIIALDFESHADQPDLPSGTEVYDSWESYTNGMELPKTIMSRSQSGGLHVLYKTGERIRSRNRILPSTDIKADGGYVVLPPAPGRSWLPLTTDEARTWPSVRIEDAPSDLLEWLIKKRSKNSSAWISTATGQRVGHAIGYDFNLFFRSGCPGGYRDDFINDLLFRLRKNNKTIEQAAEIAYSAWQRVAQPPYAKYNMPWSDVEYKLLRVWQTVKPDAVPDFIRRWQEQMNAGETDR